jgi:hypothetical protein
MKPHATARISTVRPRLRRGQNIPQAASVGVAGKVGYHTAAGCPQLSSRWRWPATGAWELCHQALPLSVAGSAAR